MHKLRSTICRRCPILRTLRQRHICTGEFVWIAIPVSPLFNSTSRKLEILRAVRHRYFDAGGFAASGEFCFGADPTAPSRTHLPKMRIVVPAAHQILRPMRNGVPDGLTAFWSLVAIPRLCGYNDGNRSFGPTT